jgi:uncharacterized protein (TIGR00730 family)
MKAVCVFCGSSPGADVGYRAAPEALGREIASRGLTVVYGGANVGLMGAVADAALADGGEVHGVLPAALRDKEIAHSRLTRLEIVESMHERKARMAELSDAFVALPGGPGTMEEIFEVWTWGQLGFHAKPVGFLNIRGFYDRLRGFIEHAAQEQFLKPAHRDMLIFRDMASEMLDALATYRPPVVDKWIARDTQL